MQFAGSAISVYQNYKNNKALKNKTKYTVMCLGESTTFEQYPKQLQKYLNKKYPNKFSVVDCGVPGISIQKILAKLDDNIKKYKPDFAICMMGINNGLFFHDSEKKYNGNKKYKFKIFKLYGILKRHITEFCNSKNLYAECENYEVIKQVDNLYSQHRYDEAVLVCENILKKYPNDNDTRALLAKLYYYHLKKQENAYNIALKIMLDNKEINNSSKNIIYRIITNYAKDRVVFEQVFDSIINDDNYLLDYDVYFNLRDKITAKHKEQILEKMFLSDNSIDEYYGILAIENLGKKDYKKAEEYFRTAEELRLKYPNEQTYGLYKLIIKKLIDNNIKVICMQYPVRSIAPLKQMLKNEEYYRQLTFVSNEDNFKNMLKIKKYNEIFRDQFAGDFGHCLYFGNKLIAKNLVESLSKLVQ